MPTRVYARDRRTVRTPSARLWVLVAYTPSKFYYKLQLNDNEKEIHVEKLIQVVGSVNK